MTRTVRRGFTLIELLVAMSLAIVLAGLAVAVAESGAFGSQKVVSGADRAAGWLIISKQRAIRDQRPRGVRFLLTPHPDTVSATPPPAGDWRNYAYSAREAQYIEVPDAWVPDRTKPTARRAFLAFVYTPATGFPMSYVSGANNDPNYYASKAKPNPQRVFVVLPDPADQAEFLQRVSAGNLLTLPGTGATFRIDQVYTPSAFGSAQLSVNGTAYASGYYELVLGQLTDRPVPAPLFTYPDLGTATSPVTTAPTQLAPGTACATEYNFAFTAGFSGGASGTGGPLPLVGEPLLQLTGNSVIDFRAPGLNGYNPAQDPYPTTGPGAPAAPFYPRTSTGLTLAGNGTTGRYIDVLFSPAGQVLGTSDGLVVLWVRDPDKTLHPRLDDPANNTGLDQAGAFDAAGEQVLVTVYPRTGLVATHPVTKGADPFAAARDGLNSGL